VQDYYGNQVLASTEDLLSTSGWRELQADFATGPQTRLIAIKVMRVPSNPLIKSTFWLDDVKLQAIEAGEAAKHSAILLCEERHHRQRGAISRHYIKGRCRWRGQSRKRSTRKSQIYPKVRATGTAPRIISLNDGKAHLPPHGAVR
jgi:hypothetical protein